MSVAVKRVREIMDVIAGPNGATASEAAAALGLGRQATVRLLDSMVLEGIADKDDGTKRYTPSLKVYDWVAKSLTRQLPSHFLRQEIAGLALRIKHPVFYCVRNGPYLVTLERTDFIGGFTVTAPNAGPSGGSVHWSKHPWGRVLVAFSADGAEMIKAELEARKDSPEDALRLRQEFQAIRHQRYGEALPSPDRFTAAAPILNGDGCATSVIAIGVNNYSPDQHEELIDQLTAVTFKASLYAGYSPEAFMAADYAEAAFG